MPCADYVDEDVQDAFVEGNAQAVEVTDLFVGNFVVHILHAAINLTGNWQGSRFAMVSGLYSPLLTDSTTLVYALLGGSVFPHVNDALRGNIIRAKKAGEGGAEYVSQSAYAAAIDKLHEQKMPAESQSAV